MLGREAAFRQGDDINGGVPNRRKTGLNPKIFRIVDEQSFEISFRFCQGGMAVRITQCMQGDERIEHRRVNSGQAIAAVADALDHPALGFLEREPAKWFPGNTMQHLERVVSAKK